MTGRHNCFVPGCTAEIAADRVGCEPHLRSIRLGLRTRLERAWKQFLYWPNSIDRRRRYLEARQCALESLKEAKAAA